LPPSQERAVPAEDGDRRKNDLRWRIGLLVGIAGSIGIGLLNYFSEHPLP